MIETLKPLGVLRISLFGSFARRDTGAFSDIDILVKLPSSQDGKSLGLKWFVLDQELEEILGVPVDLVSEASLSPHLRAVVEKEMETIYEKAG